MVQHVCWIICTLSLKSSVCDFKRIKIHLSWHAYGEYMVLNPILLGGVWFIIHRYSVFHTFIWRGWVGGLSQMKLTSFEKNCHILRRSLIKNRQENVCNGNAIYPLPMTIIQITNDNSIFRKEGIGQWGMKLRYQQEYCPANISYNLFW